MNRENQNWDEPFICSWLQCETFQPAPSINASSNEYHQNMLSKMKAAVIKLMAAWNINFFSGYLVLDLFYMNPSPIVNTTVELLIGN